MNDLIRNKTIGMISESSLAKHVYTGRHSISELLKVDVDYDSVHDYFRLKAVESKVFLSNALVGEGSGQ